MKPIFIRLEDDLESRLTELCRSQGYKKGALISKLIRQFLEKEPNSLDPIEEARNFGIDLSLTKENLKKTPTERLRLLQQVHQSAEKIRGVAWKQR